jgi:hypothetical protein
LVIKIFFSFPDYFITIFKQQLFISSKTNTLTLLNSTQMSSKGGKAPMHAGGKHITGGKRHRKVLRDNIDGVTRPSIKRLARKGGVKRIIVKIY